MIRFGTVLTLLAIVGSSVAQTRTDTDFKLSLPDRRGQLRWSAKDFKVVESSAKPDGHEIGIRGKDQSGRLTFLGFLFQVAEQAALSSAKCRDSTLEQEKKNNPSLKIVHIEDNLQPGALPISLVTYTARGRGDKTAYMVRGFVATADICGDLELYSDTPISSDDADIREIFASYELDQNYAPKFNDLLFYAQILYQARLYKAAAPIFEKALVPPKTRLRFPF